MARSATLLPALLAPLACPNDVSTLKLLHAWQEKHHQFGYYRSIMQRVEHAFLRLAMRRELLNSSDALLRYGRHRPARQTRC